MTHPEDIDPSVYLYDEVYDEIKGKEREGKEGREGREGERERSRDKPKQEVPRQSKYINKMKQLVAGRQK